MIIHEIDVKDIKQYENNARKNDKAVALVAESIENYGFKVPVIVDQNNVLVAGHTRLKAAKQLGLEKIPAIIADDLTEEQIKAYRLADNKTAELSTWDFDKLEKELEAIDDAHIWELFNQDKYSEHSGEYSVLHTRQEHNGKFKSLSGVYGHHNDRIGVVIIFIHFGY